MTVFEYHKMSEEEQMDVLMHSGVLVGERKSSFYQVKLYQIEGFYVELYHHTHFNVVVNINVFTNTDCLEPYLKAVDIDALMYA